MNEPMEKRYLGLPDLQALDSSLSEETLALNSSSSSEFEDELLSEKVDLISTTIGKDPPIIPLREERMTLGVECVFKAKGVGWSGVKKKRKKSKTSDSKQGCHQNISYKPLLQCFTNCSPIYDDCTPKSSNITKDRFLNAELKALSYPEYVDYLLRCRAKKKEYVEHPYLEVEKPKDTESVLKRRIFTRQLEARQETFDSAAISDYIVKGPVQQNEVRQNPSVSFDPLVRYYDINETDPSDTKIVYGIANDIDLLPSLQYNTKNSKTDSFADFGKKRSNRHDIYPPSQTEDDNNIDSNASCCRYENILEESFMQPGKDNMSRDAMKLMGVSDTTIATTTYCAVDIEGFDPRKRTKESESLRFSRGSSLMDSVDPKGSISQDGTIVPLSSSSCIDMQHGESNENRHECPDDSREQGLYYEERQSPSDACDVNIEPVDSSDDDGIFSYMRTPRENRFHFYFPDQVRFEESGCINKQDTALQASFAKSDSDGTPLINNGIMRSSSMGSCSNFIQSHSVEHNVEIPSQSNEVSYDLKSALHEAKVYANTMHSTPALSDEHGILATPVENIVGIKSQTVSSVGCSASFTQETEVLTQKSPVVSALRKSYETNICDVSVQSSHKKNHSSFVSMPTVENNIDCRSKPCSSIGCSTSYEWNSHSSPSKSFDRLNDIGIIERQQSPTLKQDNHAVLSPRADISIECGVKSFSDSGEVKVCDDVRHQSPSLKQDSYVVSAPRPATNIECKTQSKVCDDVSQLSPTLKQDIHGTSAPRVSKTIKHRARPCSSIGCSTSFEFDMHSSPEKTVTSGVTIKDTDSSKAANCCVEEQSSCVESENISASQMTTKLERTAESNRKTFEIGVQTSVSVSDVSLEGTRSRSPRKSPTYSIKRNTEATLDARLEDRNEETSQYSTMVDNRPPDSSKSYKHGNNVSVQSTWGKVDGDLPTLGSHVINKHSTPNHSFIKEDYDSINNDDNYEFTIPNSLSIDSCHSSLYSDEMSVTYSSHKDYTGNPRNLPPLLPRASEGRKGDKQDALSFTYTLPKSLSLSSYHSANTSLSKSSSMTHAEVEQCISYTLSELGRIHSMLDDANIQCNMDSMSCNSESTEGRDALYYARQSKNEIAALQNLIEQHINREKESNFNNHKLVKNASHVSKNTGIGVAESNSFETMISAKSHSSSIVENPSLDRLILDVSKLCTDIETRIENIVNDTNGSN